MLDLILNWGPNLYQYSWEFPCKDNGGLLLPQDPQSSSPLPWQLCAAVTTGPELPTRCPCRAVAALTPCSEFMEEMARSKTCTLHLELEVPTPVVMPKINGCADKSWGKQPAETSESSHKCSCALVEPPHSGAPGSQQEPGPAPICCRRNALLLLPRHLSAPCISILLSCALSSEGSPSPAQPELLWWRWQCPPSQQGHSPRELGLVTLQCTVFYSLGLAPDPLCTPAGRPGLAIASPPSSLSAAFTWAPLNKQFTFSQAGSVPGFLSVQHPKPDRSCSVSAVVSRHQSIQS